MGFFRDWILVHLINPIWMSALTEDDRKTVDVCHVKERQKITDYIASKSPHGLVVTGVRDAGKSTAVARVMEVFREAQKSNRDHLLVYFNVSEVSSLDELVTSFERDLGYSDLLKFIDAVQNRVGLTSEDSRDPVVRMRGIFRALRAISMNKKLVIVMDDFENIVKASGSDDKMLRTASNGLVTNLNNICRNELARVIIVSSDMNALSYFLRDRKFSDAVYFKELTKDEAFDFILLSLNKSKLNLTVETITLIRDTFSNLPSELHNVCDVILENTADLEGQPATVVQERICSFTQGLHQQKIQGMKARLSKLRRGWDRQKVMRFAKLLQLLELSGQYGVDSDEIEWLGLHDVADVLLNEHLVVLEGCRFHSSDKYFYDAIPIIVEKLYRVIGQTLEMEEAARKIVEGEAKEGGSKEGRN